MTDARILAEVGDADAFPTAAHLAPLCGTDSRHPPLGDLHPRRRQTPQTGPVPRRVRLAQ
ncbi:transposase [Streptomyces sp. NPDC102384]|uniref:transposase n=1 Tax=Streptomyces sp. NPDC102384 TaxID=3366166 RepID=UPI0037F4E8CA